MGSANDEELLRAIIAAEERTAGMHHDTIVTINMMLCTKWYCIERDIDIREISYDHLIELLLPPSDVVSDYSSSKVYKYPLEEDDVDL